MDALPGSLPLTTAQPARPRSDPSPRPDPGQGTSSTARSPPAASRWAVRPQLLAERPAPRPRSPCCSPKAACHGAWVVEAVATPVEDRLSSPVGSRSAAGPLDAGTSMHRTSRLRRPEPRGRPKAPMPYPSSMPSPPLLRSRQGGKAPQRHKVGRRGEARSNRIWHAPSSRASDALNESQGGTLPALALFVRRHRIPVAI